MVGLGVALARPPLTDAGDAAIIEVAAVGGRCLDAQALLSTDPCAVTGVGVAAHAAVCVGLAGDTLADRGFAAAIVEAALIDELTELAEAVRALFGARQVAHGARVFTFVGRGVIVTALSATLVLRQVNALWSPVFAAARPGPEILADAGVDGEVKGAN